MDTVFQSYLNIFLSYCKSGNGTTHSYNIKVLHRDSWCTVLFVVVLVL